MSKNFSREGLPSKFLSGQRMPRKMGPSKISYLDEIPGNEVWVEVIVSPCS